MLSLGRALGRAGTQLGARSVGAGGGGALVEAAGGSGARGWRSLFDEYAGRGVSRLAAAPPLTRREEEQSKGRGVHSAGHLCAGHSIYAGSPLMQQGSTFNDPDATAKEAGRPISGGPGGAGDIQGGSGGYALLAAAHGGLAAAAFMAPTAIVNFFFPGAALPQGFQAQALAKLLGCGLGAGAAASFGLKQLADSNQLASPTAQRLQLGLMGFSAGNIALHALYSPSISGTSLMAGAAVMGLTFAVPYQHYVKTNGGLKPVQAITSYFGAVPDHLNIKGLQSGLYSLLTPVLALAGASYLFAPGMSLAEVFGFVKGVDSYFLWQAIGGGLMTVAPAVTYSLKKLADGGRLGEPVAKTLNAGVAAAAAGHLAVMGPMVVANQGGPMLPIVAGAWAAALLTSGLGLMGGGRAAAAKAT
ncbi:hypothetical protein ABPG75_009904 [Micractinium tetrahymenae]